jgi:polyisoprenoid-binding protein YceI
MKMNKLFNGINLVLLLIIIGCGKKNDSNPMLKQVGTVSINHGEYKVNNYESKLIWKGKQLSTKEHDGTLEISSGSVNIDKSGNIYGDIEINMESISTTDLEGRWKEKLDGHLKSPDFFGVKSFPIASIKFNGNKNKTTNGEVKLDGYLTIKGTTHPIIFLAKLNQKGNKIIAKAPVSFDRTKYNVRYGSGKFFENLGDKLIYDEINIDVSIVAELM